MIIQRDRNYLLKVGVPGKQYLEISGLNIQFQVQKSSNNKRKGNHASVSIYNLSEDNKRVLEDDGVVVYLEVGYADTGLHELFSGQVTDIQTDRNGEDLVTILTLDSLYSGLNHTLISKLIAPGSTLEELFRRIAKDMPDVTQTKFSGPTLQKKVPDGYPVNGTPRQALTEVCDAYGLEWQIDSGILYITDVGYSFMTNKQAFVLNEMSGLIERPEVDDVEKKRSKNNQKKPKKDGLKIKCLLNPLIKSGGMIKLEFGEFSGFYKVVNITHNGEIYGNAWTTTLIVSTKNRREDEDD